jgi:hypothetical protein
MTTPPKTADAETGRVDGETKVVPDEDHPAVPAALVYVGYWILTLVLVVCGSIVALYLSALVPDVAGVFVFLTAGIVLPASAPAVAQVLLARTIPGVEIADGGRRGGELRLHPRLTGHESRRPGQPESLWFRRW